MSAARLPRLSPYKEPPLTAAPSQTIAPSEMVHDAVTEREGEDRQGRHTTRSLEKDADV